MVLKHERKCLEQGRLGNQRALIHPRENPACVPCDIDQRGLPSVHGGGFVAHLGGGGDQVGWHGALDLNIHIPDLKMDMIRGHGA